MWEIFSSPFAQTVLWMSGLAALVVAGVYVIGSVRPQGKPARDSAGELLTEFREMYDQGELTAEEFRAIKSKLKQPLPQELNDNGQAG